MMAERIAVYHHPTLKTDVVRLEIHPKLDPDPILVSVRGTLVQLEAGTEDWLPSDEREYLQTLSATKRRQSYLLGRCAAYQALAAAGADASVVIRRGVFTQPVVMNHGTPALDISISHSQEIGVTLAFPRTFPMAIDIEPVDCILSDVIRDQMTGTELKKLFQLDDSFSEAMRLTILWCAKEALSKALGCGLTCPMTVLEIDDLAVSHHGITGTYRNFSQYRFHATPCADNHAMAIVMHRNYYFEAPLTF